VRQPRLDDRRVQFAAIHEDRGDEIQEHQRDDDRRQAGIHGHVIVGEAREILSEHDARYQRRHQGEDDARQDLQEAAAAGRKPCVQNKQGDDQGRNGDAVARNIEKLLVGFHDKWNVPPYRLDDQGAEHDQERHHQRGDGGDQRVADRFQPQPVPAPRFDYRIGAVERDTQGLDAIGGEIHREHRADGQDVAAGGRHDVVDLAGQRIGDLLRPDLQQQSRGLIGELL